VLFEKWCEDVLDKLNVFFCSERKVGLFAEKRLGPSPPGVNLAEGSRTFNGRVRIITVLKGRIETQRAFQRMHEDRIVDATTSRSRDGRSDRHRIGVLRRPLKDLRRSERPAGNQTQFLDAERGYKRLLQSNIIKVSYGGVARPLKR
jgi:hypothetical protein